MNVLSPACAAVTRGIIEADKRAKDRRKALEERRRGEQRNVNAVMLRSYSLLKKSAITACLSRLIVCNNIRREC